MAKKSKSKVKAVKTAPKKKAIRREWSRDDVRELKSMAKQKAGLSKISKKLKRTPAATASKAATLGVSLSMR